MKEFYTSKRRIEIDKPLIMGILNITPDSFSDGGLFFPTDRAISRALEMVKEGADIIDVGAESTRPGSKSISVEEELDRLLPVLRELLKKVDIPISVDTRKPEVAKICIEEGVEIINDVSGLKNDRMLELAISSKAAFIAMHMRGEPEYMHKLPPSENILGEINEFFLKLLSVKGLNDRLILDPGIGFGKNVNENFEILSSLDKLKIGECPLLIGVSKKSFLGNFLGREVDERLPATIAANLFGIIKGVDILRVHDVRENKDAIEVFYKLMKEDF